MSDPTSPKSSNHSARIKRRVSPAVWVLLFLGGAAWLGLGLSTAFLIKSVATGTRPTGGYSCNRARNLYSRTIENSQLRGTFGEGLLLDGSLPEVGGAWVLDARLGQDAGVAARDRGYENETWRSALRGFRFKRGWKNVWLLGGDRYSADNFVTEVMEFETSKNAILFQKFAINDACEFFLDVYTFPGAADALGVQLRLAGVDRISDQASFVVKNRRYLLLLGSVEREPDRGLLKRLVEEARAPASAPADACESLGTVLSKLEASRSSGFQNPNGSLESSLVMEVLPGFAVEGESKGTVITTSSGAADSYHRSWRNGPVRFTAEVAEFKEPAAAYAEMFRATLARCGKAASIYRSPDLEGSVGVTEVNPEDLRDLLAFVRGTRLYLLEVAGPGEEIPNELYSDIPSKAAALAR